MPESALHAAERAQVREIVLDDAARPGEPRLRRLDDGSWQRERLQPALMAWLAQVCRTHALLLLVDDVQRVDEASLAWLAALAV